MRERSYAAQIRISSELKFTATTRKFLKYVWVKVGNYESSDYIRRDRVSGSDGDRGGGNGRDTAFSSEANNTRYQCMTYRAGEGQLKNTRETRRNSETR